MDEASDRPDKQSLTIPWQKPPSKRSRRILLPHNASRSDFRPEQFERRARLVSTLARGRRWLVMEGALFEAVRQKSLAQWSHRTIVRNKSDHLLTGLLFDDAGHRMIPTHATKAGVRHRYYVSMPFLHGEAKTASAGSISRVPAADIEDAVVKFLKEHLIAQQDGATSSAVRLGARSDLAELVAGIVVHRDRLIVRFKSLTDEGSDSPDDRSFTIPWQKPPSKRSRQILLPHNASRSDVRPEQLERRARLVSAIARGRRWLDDVVSGRVTTVAELCAREKCSVRQVNMTISLAFLAPNLVKAAVEGRLPRGIGIERLRDPPTDWSRQFEALGLNPEKLQRWSRMPQIYGRAPIIWLQLHSDFALNPGRRERNFCMQRRSAKNGHSNAPTPAETKIRKVRGRKCPQKRPI